MDPMSLKLREFQISDIGPIDKIYQAQDKYGLPSLRHVLGHATIIKDDQVVGYGTLKMFAECIMLLSKELSKYDRSKAVLECINLAEKVGKAKNLEQIYLFTDDDSYANLLIKHFTFRDVVGRLLTKDLDDGR